MSAFIAFPYGQLFDRYDSFNAVQSALLNDLLHTEKSVVLNAPTGSGKTVAFELAIVRMLQQCKFYQQQQQQNQQGVKHDIPLKGIYVAPIKALCAEKFAEWKARFEPLNVNCVQITGDSDIASLLAIRDVQLVITTPEKWDSLTRHWHEYREVVGAVRLFMVDEVHLLNEDFRGPILEAIVSRMKTIASSSSAALRFVIASATIPNVKDLAAWIGNGSNGAGVAELVFSNMQRPVPLEKHILGFNSRLNGFQFDMSLNYKLPEILRNYSERKATLIFCNSRKSTEMAAAALEKHVLTIFPLSEQQKSCLALLAQRLHETKLRKLVIQGIAFHHAGMTYADREKIEESFRQGLLMVLLSTNTLAMGVNFPAHLVVIKSTESYMLGSYVEYPESTLLQMIGRAGRPQYDTKGVAVIMTHMRNVSKYENLMNSKVPVESHLHKRLAEHLNAEIALNTITNLEMAMKWVRSTYLYVRSVRNPLHYGLEAHLDKDMIEQKLEELCMRQIDALHDAGLITMNIGQNLELQITPYGRLMSKYYLCFETMKLFRQIRGCETFLELLNMIVRCKEFEEFTLRVNEKKLLNEINSSPIRFPIRGRIKTAADKISCLIQAVLGNLKISSPGLAQESVKMLRIGDRVAKCLLEYLRLSGNKFNDLEAGCYKALLNIVTISKCFHATLWENSDFASKQLRKIGTVYSGLLASAGKVTLKSIAETDARTIELILSKPHPFGDEVLQNLHSFPEYKLEMNLKCANMIHVQVRQINEAYEFNGASAVILVGDTANNLLFFNESLDSIIQEYGVFERTVKLVDPTVENVSAHVIHSTLVGVDAHAAIVVNAPKQEATKRTTKRKKQAKLDVSFGYAKKLKSSTDQPMARKGETSVNISSNSDDCFETNNLRNFRYTKPKLQRLLNSSLASCIVRNTESLTESHSLDVTNLSEINDHYDPESSRRNNVESNDKSLLVQTKVTEFFANRKNCRKSYTEELDAAKNEFGEDKTMMVEHDEETSTWDKEELTEKDQDMTYEEGSTMNGKEDSIMNDKQRSTTENIRDLSIVDKEDSTVKDKTRRSSMTNKGESTNEHHLTISDSTLTSGDKTISDDTAALTSNDVAESVIESNKTNSTTNKNDKKTKVSVYDTTFVKRTMDSFLGKITTKPCDLNVSLSITEQDCVTTENLNPLDQKLNINSKNTSIDSLKGYDSNFTETDLLNETRLKSNVGVSSKSRVIDSGKAKATHHSPFVPAAQSINVSEVAEILDLSKKSVTPNGLITKPRAPTEKSKVIDSVKTATSNHRSFAPAAKPTNISDVTEILDLRQNPVTANGLITEHRAPTDNVAVQTEQLQQSPTGYDIMFCYKLAKTFFKLKREQQTLANFKILYTKLYSSREDLKSTSTSTMSTSAISILGDFANRVNQITSPTSNNKSTVDAPRAISDNPFRLQIFKNHAKPTGELKRVTVDNINRRVMSFVLHKKCENNASADDGESLSAIGEKVLKDSNQTQDERSMTFEEYCSMYMDA